MLRPNIPPRETDFMSLKVGRDGSAYVTQHYPRVTEQLLRRSEKVRSLLSHIPIDRNLVYIDDVTINQLIRDVLSVFEIGPEISLATVKRALNEHGWLRLSYIPPGQLFVRWAGSPPLKLELDVQEDDASAPPDNARSASSNRARSKGVRYDDRPQIQANLEEEMQKTLRAMREEFEKEILATRRSLSDLASKVGVLTLEVDAKLDQLKADLRAEIATQLASGAAAAANTLDEATIQLWVAQLSNYLSHFAATIKHVPNGPERAQLDDTESRYRTDLEKVRTALADNRLPEASDVVRSLSVFSLRDATVALMNLVNSSGAIAKGSETEAFEAELGQLEEMTGLERIVPKLGEPLNATEHQYEPQGVASEHPRGTIARVLSRGYRFNQSVFRRARVELSKGPAEPTA